MKKGDLVNIMDFGLLALVGTIWFATIIVYGACIAAARADRFTQQTFFAINTGGSGDQIEDC